MFHLPGGPLPFRDRREFARAQMLGDLIRQPRESMHGNRSDDMWMPMMPPDQWLRNGMGRPTKMHESRFEELDDIPLPRSIASETGYPSFYAKGFGSSGGLNTSNQNSYMRDFGRSEFGGSEGPGMSFERAVTTLDEAISAALSFCEKIETDFGKDTNNIAAFAHPKIIDALWTMKLDWNGVSANDFAKDPDAKAPRDVATYSAVMRSLLQAIADVRSTDSLQTRDLDDLDTSALSPESVKTALRKLNITLQGIEELVHTVKAYRKRMPALNKELAFANSLLTELRDLWTPRKRRDQWRRTHDEY